MAQTYSPKTQRAIKAYGIAACLEAFRKHDKDGEGAFTVGFYMGLKTNQADAAINAGREIEEACTLHIQFKVKGDDVWRQATVPGSEMIVAYSATSNDCFAPSRQEVQRNAASERANRLASPRKVACLQIL